MAHCNRDRVAEVMGIAVLLLTFLTFSPVSAQTFNGGDIEDGANWTGGLPTDPLNPGLINTDGFFQTLIGLYIVQQSGTVTRSGGNQVLSGHG